MERKRLNAAILLLTLPGLAPAASFFGPRPPKPSSVLAIPSANVLVHGQYRLAGRFQYFTSSEFGDTASGADTTEVQSLNYTSELLFGLENRAELGVQYGNELSFSLKALILREDLFWPDIVFGVRNLFGAQEGGLYGVTSSSTLKSLRGESFVTLAKTFPSKTRVHLGMSILNGANKGLASANGGVEQDLGAGAFLAYEFFERFSDFHQVLSLQWSFRNTVSLSLGLTEFQSWIRQNGEWGFFLAPASPLPDGYNSPGITFALTFQGWVPHREKKTVPERLTQLEVRNAVLEMKLKRLETCMCLPPDSLRPRTAATIAPPAPPAPNPGKALEEKVVASLRLIAEKTVSDLTDPEEIRKTMADVVEMGPEGSQALRRIAADTGAANYLRIPAVLVMAFSKDTGYVAPLRALCADRNARMRREALTALIKLDSRAALEDARRLLSDSDENVALAAGEAYRRLSGQPAEEKPAAREIPPPRAQESPAPKPKAAPAAKPGATKQAAGKRKAH